MDSSSRCDASQPEMTSFNPVPIVIKAEGGGGVPVGTVIAWPAASNPKDADKWLECNGQAVSAAVYPELAAIVGPNVPDYRGLFLRGYGSQASYHYGAVWHSSGGLGQLQGDAIRNITGTTSTDDSNTGYCGGAFRAGARSGFPETDYWNYEVRNSNPWVYFDASYVVPTSNENRPVNKAVRYLIRAKL